MTERDVASATTDMGQPTNSHDVFYDSALVEETVLRAESRQPFLRRLRFRQERDRLYEIDDPEQRERAFEHFHRRWFAQMGLGESVAAALAEHPSLGPRTRRCIVSPAVRAGDEGADLRDERRLDESGVPERACGRQGSLPTIVVQIRAATLVDRDACRRLLAHELLHLTDMLDPAFGYRPELPPIEGGPARLRRVMDRYRVLWDCTIDGRLHGRGRVGDEIAVARRREFEAWYPELGPDTEREFRRWFEGPRPTHDQIAAAALDGVSAARSGVCPLCSFAYPELLTDSPMSGTVLEHVRADFLAWRPEQGICRQCLDLYAARSGESVTKASGNRSLASGGAGAAHPGRTGSEPDAVDAGTPIRGVSAHESSKQRRTPS
jgi:hypothetical protein